MPRLAAGILEIAYEGGPLGNVVYGASAEAGIAAYEQALALDPANMSIAWQYAFQLAGFGGADRLARASELIGGITARKPRTALETILRDAALDLTKPSPPLSLPLVALRLGRMEPLDRPAATPGKR